MSQRTHINTPQHEQSFDTSESLRPANKNNSLIAQISIDPTDYLRQTLVRNPFAQKHKTFNGVDSSTNLIRKNYQPDRYRLQSIDQKKMFIALALVEQFILTYHEQKLIDDAHTKKLHQDRKKAFLLNSSSEFKTIEPISHAHIDQEESYLFLIQFRNQLKTTLRQNVIKEIKKRRDKLSLIYKEEKLDSIEETEKENVRQSSFKKLQQNTFVTADFNCTAMQANFPQVDMMALSIIPPNLKDMLKTSPKTNPLKIQTKFHPLKHTHTRLRIHPAKNKYQSRKKQQIRLFMQLDEKTEHLQNFRSEEGKFFKLNQNLKITIKNVNMCRIVLLGKKAAIMQQFDRLGDDQYFRAINEKIAGIEGAVVGRGNIGKERQSQEATLTDSREPKVNIKVSDQTHDKRFTETSPEGQFFRSHKRNTSTASQAVNAHKQKALRIKFYIQQTTRYFTQIQSFLTTFLQNDKGYQSYKKENSLKQKMITTTPLSQQQVFYRDFIDRCFHLSEISRIYFNALNQFAHQNTSLKEMKLLQKQQLDRVNKRLIEVRYALIYMQKECENTSDTSFFNQTITHNPITQTFRNTPLCQQAPDMTSHSSHPNMRTLLGAKPIIESTVKTLLKQTQNILHLTVSPQSHMSRNQSSKVNIKSASKLLPVPNPIQEQYFPKPGLKRQSRQRQPRVSSSSVKQEDIDVNVIWKTFYNKKFSSNAMRLRLY